MYNTELKVRWKTVYGTEAPRMKPDLLRYAVVAFMKIPHRPSMLTNHLADMRKYMPAEHRQLIETVEAMPSVREFADRQPYNAVLDAIGDFRTIHYGWAQEYINRWTDDPRGTGGTPYMEWLQQLIEETRSFKIV